MNIAVDFDGTIVTHEYPKIGKELPFATQTLRMLQEDHHRLILWSCREGELLEDAINWLKERGVEMYAYNRDYPEETTDSKDWSRKLKVDMFIDDRNLGGLPDWGTIYQMVKNRTKWEDVIDEAHSSSMYGDSHHQEHQKKKKKWWQI